MNFTQLRAQHPRFWYRSFSSEVTAKGLELRFLFQTEPDLSFQPTLLIEGVTQELIKDIPVSILNKYIFHIGLVEMISYWKAACSPEIIIEAGVLGYEELEWWKDLLIQGLGEFFFVNDIDFTVKDFVTFKCHAADGTNLDTASGTSMTSEDEDTSQLEPHPTILIPVGGGKDSAVTLELLKEYQTNHHPDKTASIAALLLNPTPASLEMVKTSGIERSLVLRRTIDPALIQLNQQGYLNGHTPFSSLLAFMSVLTARIFNYDLIALSNERSSNEGNADFHGYEINHQYSKSFEFELKFKEYCQFYLVDNIASLKGYYFSFLRPLFELQIAKLFADLPQHHHLFRSCNRGQKTNTWCGDCPKCLFAFSILYPFLGKDKMTEIFGQDLFAKPEMLPLALELLGYAEKKPLECVGTHEENMSAFYMSYQRAQDEYDELPELLKLVHDQVLSHESDLAERAQTILTSWNPDHTLPLKLEKFLQSKLG